MCSTAPHRFSQKHKPLALPSEAPAWSSPSQRAGRPAQGHSFSTQDWGGPKALCGPAGQQWGANLLLKHRSGDWDSSCFLWQFSFINPGLTLALHVILWFRNGLRTKPSDLLLITSALISWTHRFARKFSHGAIFLKNSLNILQGRLMSGLSNYLMVLLI